LSAIVGLDAGGTKILGIAYELAGPDVGASLTEERVATPTGDARAFIDGAVTLVETLQGRIDHPVVAVGLGAPGLIDREGRLRFGPNLPGVVDVPLREELHRRLSLPVVVENDATSATWAEFCRGNHGRGDLVLVTLGTGIGGGWVHDGRLVRGRSGFAGEVGHMVVDVDGPPCPCGNRGCWERYASGSGLGRMARDAALAGKAARLVELAGGDPEAVRGEHVAIAARGGDEEANVIMHQLAWWIALGLANLVNILDPEVIVIGGGLVAAADLFLEPTRHALAELTFASDRRPPVTVEPAALGEEAGALGAALLAGEKPVPGGRTGRR
jgi:glucokinase